MESGEDWIQRELNAMIERTLKKIGPTQYPRQLFLRTFYECACLGLTFNQDVKEFFNPFKWAEIYKEHPTYSKFSQIILAQVKKFLKKYIK